MKVANLLLSERAARAERRQEQATRRALDRLLDLNMSFQAEKGSAAMSQTACESACELFACDHAILMEIESRGMTLAAMHPPHQDVPMGLRFSISDDPDLEERLRSRIPSFKANSERTLGPGIASLAARLEQASVLRAPIGVGPVADRLLVLGWVHPHEEPDALMLALLQRFGDQVSAALSQARRQEARAGVRGAAPALRAQAAADAADHPSGAQVYRHSIDRASAGWRWAATSSTSSIAATPAWRSSSAT